MTSQKKNIETRINIAYLIDAVISDKAGTEKQLLNIVRLLDRKDYNPILICMRNSDWLENNAKNMQCKVFVLDYHGFFSPRFPAVVSNLLNIIKTEKVHILQTFFEDSMFVGWMAKIMSPRHPVLITSRRDMGLGADTPWYHNVYRLLMPIINRRVDGIAANGLSIKEYTSLRENVAMDKITVIHNGISMPTKVSPPDIFSQIPCDIWLGIAANLKPVKRIDTFINAIALIKERCGLRVHGIIFGEGSLRNELHNLSFKLHVQDEVHFLGSIDNITDYLHHLHIGILCSEKEGFPNAILEYMACSLPVVASAVGGNRELIDDKNGILFPPGDHEALAGAVLKLAQDSRLREEMGKISKERVIRWFLWDTIMSQWERYYNSFLQ